MEIEEILKLPDYREITTRLTSKYKDDIIVKHEYISKPTFLDKNYYWINFYMLYKKDNRYIKCGGRLTKDIIVEGCIYFIITDIEDKFIKHIECNNI